MNGLKVSMLVGAVGLGLAGGAQAALTGSNLGFEDGNTVWTATSTGTNAIGAFGNEFRTAGAEANWFGSTTALLMDMNPADLESGTLGQELTGTAEAGTYTWSISEAGMTTFADNGGFSFTYGFSLDGVTFIAGSSQTLVEGVDLFAPDVNPTGDFNGSVSYTATGGEAALHLLIATAAGDNVRSVATIDETALTFVPEPGSLALLGLGGLALLRRRRA